MNAATSLGTLHVANAHSAGHAGQRELTSSPPTSVRTSDGEEQLASKKCIPCSTKDLQPLSLERAAQLQEQVAKWDLVEVEGIPRLRRAWKSKNFLKGIEFFSRVAAIAEAEGHHPDLHLVGWNNLSIDIWTHSIGGLHENDFILAAKIDAVDSSDLMRKAKAAQPPQAEGGAT